LSIHAPPIAQIRRSRRTWTYFFGEVDFEALAFSKRVFKRTFFYLYVRAFRLSPLFADFLPIPLVHRWKTPRREPSHNGWFFFFFFFHSPPRCLGKVDLLLRCFCIFPSPLGKFSDKFDASVFTHTTVPPSCSRIARRFIRAWIIGQQFDMSVFDELSLSLQVYLSPEPPGRGPRRKISSL